jgi:hypothetical protein
MRIDRLATAGLFLFVLAGCGDPGPKMYNVSGTVTYGGKPVPRFEIRFNPDYMKGNDGPPGSVFAREGKFDTRDGGRGVIGGPYNIVIIGFDGKPAPEQPHGKIMFQHEESRELAKQDNELTFAIQGKK